MYGVIPQKIALFANIPASKVGSLHTFTHIF
jgi:hypothetical protein